MVNGAPIGCIRVSFGYMSTFEDAEKFIEFVKQCLVDKPCSTEDNHLREHEQFQPKTQNVLVPAVTRDAENGTLRKEVQDLKKQMADLADSVKSLALKVTSAMRMTCI